MTQGSDLIVVGASTRAAAWSARRAGWSPWCVDLFGDRDLHQVAHVQPLPAGQYPHGLVALLKQVPSAPLMYTGALENRPGLVRTLANRFTLWGNGADVLHKVRAPLRLARSLNRAGLPHPRVLHAAPKGMTRTRWLLKPRAGASGTGIRFWAGGGVGKSHYLQEWIEGWPCAGLFVGGESGAARFLGATRQLIGESWLHARPFRYCGSLGPLSLTDTQHAAFANLGKVLVQDFGLRGIFGVDCVMHEGLPFPVEVNPRYTASAEILELANHSSILAWHGASFDATLPAATWGPCHGGFLGKAIIFAETSFVFPEKGPWDENLARQPSLWDVLEYADVPAAGQPITKGQPVLTVFAGGKTLEACERKLREKVRERPW